LPQPTARFVFPLTTGNCFATASGGRMSFS